MSVMEKEQRARTRRSFTDEFKRDAVAMVLDDGNWRLVPPATFGSTPSFSRKSHLASMSDPPGEAMLTIRPGDVVHTPSGEWHWHGAAPDHFPPGAHRRTSDMGGPCHRRRIPRRHVAELSVQDAARLPERYMRSMTNDYVEDYLMIERVEPGALWFEAEIGPVKVPKGASDVVQPGWSVNIVGRAGGTWRVLAVGNVYP